MKYLLLISALFILQTIAAQDKIDFNYTKDFNSLFEETKNEKSKLYYAKLFPRFVIGDTTLTNYEMLALQVGYTDNENYWPYEDITIEREIWNLNENGKYKESVKKCNTLLESNPFSLIGNREKSYAYTKLGIEDSVDQYMNRFNLVALSCLASGSGASIESSWFVLSPADGQWLIRLAFQSKVCFMGSGRDKNGNFHDILGFKLEDNEECIHLYFNIEHAAKRMFGKDGIDPFNEKEKKGSKKKKK